MPSSKRTVGNARGRLLVTDYKDVLIKPSLHNNIIAVADYRYNYSYLAKQHVSALLGHHQAYKTVVLVKVHSVVQVKPLNVP